MKWYFPKLEKPKPCSRCRRAPRIVDSKCGHCFAEEVRKFEERSAKSRLVVR